MICLFILIIIAIIFGLGFLCGLLYSLDKRLENLFKEEETTDENEDF